MSLLSGYRSLLNAYIFLLQVTNTTIIVDGPLSQVCMSFLSVHMSLSSVFPSLLSVCKT